MPQKKDSPWDADLTGSVASTVVAKVAHPFISVNSFDKKAG